MIQIANSYLYDALIEEFESRTNSEEAQVTGQLDQVRQKAFDFFKLNGFPTVKNEDWRFTNIQPFLEAGYQMKTEAVNKADIEAAISKFAVPRLDAYLLVLVNGHVHFALSKLPPEELAVVDSISDISNTSAYIKQLNSAITKSSTVALNTALFKDGLYLEIKKNKVLDKPVQILHVYTNAGDTLFQPRHRVVIHQGAEAEIIENSVVLNNEGVFLVNSVTEVEVRDNARLIHYQIQNYKANERVITYTHVSQERSSRYDNFTFSMPGADLLRNDLITSLDAPATETHLYGLYLVAGKQLTDNHTAIHHRFPSCQSNEIYKGVLLDSSRGVFNGKVLVDKEAQKTNAFQQNNNLLLSDSAKVNAKPQLEIFADDVKCSHGCTVGQFNPESLFYLRSRGIGEAEARKLLVEAFMFDVTDKIGNEAIKQFVQQLIYKKLDKALAHLND